MAIPLALMAGAATAGITANSQRTREKRSQQNQLALMREQFNNQKQLNQQGADLQYQQWEKTNYPAQMEMLKKAGLNPALLYGMGGAGGATAGSQGGGTAQGGSAPQPQQLDIAGAVQVGLMEAQKENIKAQTDKTKTETENMGEGGVNRNETLAKIDNLIANTNNTKTIKELNELKLELDNIYEGQRRAGENTKLEAEGRKTTEEAYRLDRTNEEYINQERLKTIGMITDNIQKEENVNLTRKQQWQIDEAIEQNWEKISLYDTEVNIKIAQTILNGIGTIGGLLQAGKLAAAMKNAKTKMTEKTTTTKYE